VAKVKIQRPFKIAGQQVPAGSRQLVELHMAGLYTSSEVVLPVHVVHGRRPGPRLFVSAAVHGDEINGIEAIRQLLKLKLLKGMRGTLLAVPVVNVHGFLGRSRYTPGRRDLNRSFPGLAKGSLAARVAKAFMDEVVSRCSYGIDLHTGSNHRTNLPHVRANVDDEETRRLAEAFAAPVIVNATLRDGSLRQAASEQGARTLLFEGGEVLRYRPEVTRAAVRGVLGVLGELGMIRHSRQRPATPPFVAQATSWVRAPESGLLTAEVGLGETIDAGQRLGVISDPFSLKETPVIAPKQGLVIGALECPLVNEGDALFHVALADDLDGAEAAVLEFEQFDPDLDDSAIED